MRKRQSLRQSRPAIHRHGVEIRRDTDTSDALLLRHVWERPADARATDLVRLGGVIGNHAVAQRLAASPTVQRAAVKDTELGGIKLIAEVGTDFRTNHMAADVDKAKELSKNRVHRSNKNTVVLSSQSDMATAMANAQYSATPLMVSGLNSVKITSLPKRAVTPAAVTSQTVEQGPDPIKVKVRLVANDEARQSTAPTNSATGPIVLATGVQG